MHEAGRLAPAPTKTGADKPRPCKVKDKTAGRDACGHAMLSLRPRDESRVRRAERRLSAALPGRLAPAPTKIGARTAPPLPTTPRLTARLPASFKRRPCSGGRC